MLCSVCKGCDVPQNRMWREHLDSAVEEELRCRCVRRPVQHFDARQGFEEQHDERRLVHEVRQHPLHLAHGVHLASGTVSISKTPEGLLTDLVMQPAAGVQSA